jgi:hypothetical protein
MINQFPYTRIKNLVRLNIDTCDLMLQWLSLLGVKRLEFIIIFAHLMGRGILFRVIKRPHVPRGKNSLFPVKKINGSRLDSSFPSGFLIF